ncbi:arsenite efflux membrane protein ArsB [Motilibacter rhizosphaerae]|uniref:Arsenite efflux membrane protein ArsB n=1 Tax=Motilibacter rhizosphaerae TaxID=598652 RepID=A0A4Q7NS90_9ACTN|nr:SLC13 family permease [Motilibacter rhizosphaerae]RZS89638.1 arsenite efflux membrane protein ArsB [Motilibacter rhizosphaerae]
MPILAALAGLLVVLTGLVPWDAAQDVGSRTAPVLGFLVAITLVAELADEAGLFDVAARRAALLGGGSTRRLFLLVCALATVLTTVLSLDTTAVLLTPVVLALAAAAEVDPLPFAYATVWLAGTASMLLPVSNLTNLLAGSELHLSALGFAARTWPAQVVLLVVTVGLLLVRHRARLRGTYALPGEVVVEDRVLLWTAGLVCVLTGPAVVAGAPAWTVALAGAVVLLAAYAVRRPGALAPRRLAGLLPWRLVLLTVGLFLVVEALHRHGLTTALRTVAGGSGDGALALLRLSGTSVVAANLVNNLPAYLAVEPLAHSTTRLLAVLVGVDAGPLVLLWGSLATLLWRERCAARGLRVGAGEFAREGLLLVVPAVGLGTLALLLTR